MKRAAILLLLLGCKGPGNDARIDAASPIDGDAFRPVGLAVVERCGSLDCHGSKYRNMRLFGLGSTRLDPNQMPDAPDTTPDELARDYDAIVSLEPDILQQVVADNGFYAERLTFIRKGSLLEAHKGGQRLVPGDAADVCVRSWLSSTIDAKACKAAVPRLNEP